MKRIRLFGLILLFLLGVVFLSGCSIIFTAPDCCTPPTTSPITPPIIPPQTCTLTVTAGYWVWGEIYLDGQATRQWIDYSIPSMKTVTLSAPCNQTVEVKIVDTCGYESHKEYVYIYTGSGTNYLLFAYW